MPSLAQRIKNLEDLKSENSNEEILKRISDLEKIVQVDILKEEETKPENNSIPAETPIENPKENISQ